MAAGHPLTAEAGAAVLREGGNAVDAAVAAVLTSFVAESPLTGLGAGGFMLVHAPDENVLLDFFVAVPGKDGIERRSELDPVPVYFSEDVPQIFNVGAASCGVPGTAAGLWEALRRFGSMPMAELARPAVRSRARGRGGERRAGVHLQDPRADPHPPARGTSDLRAAGPAGSARATCSGSRSSRRRWSATGPRARSPSTGASSRERSRSGWSSAAGPWGSRTSAPMSRSRDIRRGGGFRGRDVLTNPPPSSGGILIAFGLDLLDRLGAAGVEEVVAVMEEAQAARTEEFHAGLYEDGWLELFLDPARLDAAAERARSRLRPPGDGVAGPGDRLGSTTHITAVDGDGRCASVTCSNGTGSGLIVPGTGVHVNNMLGEEDLNPFGFHTLPAGRRMPSMMSPTVLLRDGELEAGPRQRRLEPDPLRGPADDRPPGRRRDGGRRGGRGAARPLRGGRRAGRAGHRPRGPGAPRGARVHDRPLGGAEPVLRRRPRRVETPNGELRGGDPRRGGAIAVAITPAEPRLRLRRGGSGARAAGPHSPDDFVASPSSHLGPRLALSRE